jgi:hypothetical protein
MYRRLLWFLLACNIVVLLLFSFKYFALLDPLADVGDTAKLNGTVANHFLILGALPFTISLIFIFRALSHLASRKKSRSTLLDSSLVNNNDED